MSYPLACGHIYVYMHPRDQLWVALPAVITPWCIAAFRGVGRAETTNEQANTTLCYTEYDQFSDLASYISEYIYCIQKTKL